MSDTPVCRLPFTEAALAETSPTGWRHVSEFLQGLIARRPIADNGPTAHEWYAERWILGSLAIELSFIAREAGEVVPELPMELGDDPVSRARYLVTQQAQAKDALDRQHDRERGDATARAERVQQRWSE